MYQNFRLVWRAVFSYDGPKFEKKHSIFSKNLEKKCFFFFQSLEHHNKKNHSSNKSEILVHDYMLPPE